LEAQVHKSYFKETYLSCLEIYQQITPNILVRTSQNATVLGIPDNQIIDTETQNKKYVIH